MNSLKQKGLRYAIVLLTAALFATVGSIARADDASDNRSLRNGAVEDVTPQQKYRSAIREAGGAYKESQRECARLAAGERTACLREAKATYDQDMADAKRLLKP